MSSDDDDYDHFLQTHSMQLAISDVPERFWRTLFSKLKNELFDAGNYFSLECQEVDEDDSDDNGMTGDKEPSESDQGSVSGESASKYGKVDLEETAPVYVIGDAAYVRSPGSICLGSRYKRKFATGEKWKVMVSCENGLDVNDPQCIFLIDHAWTYLANDARQQLMSSPALLARLCGLMEIEMDDLTHEEQIQLVLKQMWLYNQTYSIQSHGLAVENRMPVWYVMDEFGSRVGHSDTPNVRFVPFYYVPQGISFTLMFPTNNINYGEAVTRDFVEGALYHRPEWRQFYLLPWAFVDHSALAYDFVSPEDSFFKQDRNDEQLLDASIPSSGQRKNPLKVYSEYSKIRDFLKNPQFQIVESKEEADVLWLYDHFKQYKSLIQHRPDILVNQIPFEGVLTVKDLLAAALHSWYHNRASSSGDQSLFDPISLEPVPKWFAATYNLRTELPQFISYYQNREKIGLDNHWIIKPWNLARGLDITVTSDLNHIIRLIGSGPKIACKYIEDPVLFYRDDIDSWVKFDLRFIVMLRSVRPMVAYLYNRFWLRFALKGFSLDALDDYEKHFTVFNYMDSSKIKQMYSEDFTDEFQRQYPQYKWNDVQQGISSSLKELLEIVCSRDPPKGLASYPQCRAMYGVDVMLKWSLNEKGEKVIQPVILEVNFMPDCARACDYYPDFVNTVFEVLFSDEVSDDLPVTRL